MPGTRKLGRPTAHRTAMLRGMVTYLLENGSIETTLTRAKEVRSLTDKMITLGKKNTLASKRAALSFITKEDVVKKLFNNIAPELSDRNGGYTNLYKLGPRRGDGAEMALIKLIDKESAKEEKKESGKKTAAKKPAAKTAGKKTAAKAAAKKTEEAVKEEIEAKAEEAEAKVEEAVEAKAEEKAEEAVEEAKAEVAEEKTEAAEEPKAE